MSEEWKISMNVGFDFRFDGKTKQLQSQFHGEQPRWTDMISAADAQRQVSRTSLFPFLEITSSKPSSTGYLPHAPCIHHWGQKLCTFRRRLS